MGGRFGGLGRDVGFFVALAVPVSRAAGVVATGLAVDGAKVGVAAGTVATTPTTDGADVTLVAERAGGAVAGGEL